MWNITWWVVTAERWAGLVERQVPLTQPLTFLQFGHTHNRIEVPATDASFVQYSATGTSMSLDYEQHPLNFRLWTIDNSDSSRSPKITNELVYLPRAMCPPLIPMEDIAKMGPRPVPPDGRVVKPGKEFLDRIEERRREILGSQMKF